MRLQGEVALITAAASGMGRAAAKLFAAEGASVGVVDISEDGAKAVAAEITEAGGQAIAIAADLTKDEDSKRIVHDTVGTFGGLDILWNHVGHPGPARVEGVDMGDYEAAMDLNIRTVLVTTGEAVPAMRARGGGSILFTASVAGLAGSAFSPVYSAAKFGVVGLMMSLAGRLAADNIRVNAVCPGPIETPMLEIFMGRPDQQTDPEENKARMKTLIPMGRTGKPEEVAYAGLFLASKEASYVTGVALPVDGGFVSR